MTNKIFSNLNYDTCLYLENLNLTYKEMLDYIDLRISISQLSILFKKFGIKHKSKLERLKDEIIKNGSNQQLAIRYNVSRRTIIKLKKEGLNKMTKYSIKEKDNNIEIVISGHSGYDEIGKDIICSSISTLIQFTIMLLENTCKTKLSKEVKNGFVKMEISNPNELENKIIKDFELFMENIERQYPLNIKRVYE